MPEELYLIDGNSYAYRAFYALGQLINSRGEAVGAIYGFFNMLFKLIREKNPGYLAIAFDHPSPTFRHEKFADYKIQRPGMPDELIGQLSRIKEIARLMSVVTIEKPGFEADDILGTLAEAFKKKVEVFIITGDKDMLQLVDDRVKVIDTHKDNLIFDGEEVKKKFGVAPAQMVDYLALRGDASDNVPGIPGIGPKTAQELISRFGSLEEIYQNLDSIKQSKTKELLTLHKDKASLSRELALLDLKVPLPGIELTALARGGFDKEPLKKVFKELEFNRLLERVEAL